MLATPSGTPVASAAIGMAPAVSAARSAPTTPTASNHSTKATQLATVK
jgi:hypothetical protein